MSLIHEALRKARQEKVQRDDPGVIYPRGLTGRRPRRSLVAGVVVGIALTIAASALAGGILWWVMKGRPSRGSAEVLPAVSTAPAMAESTVDGPESDQSPVPDVAAAVEPEPPPDESTPPSDDDLTRSRPDGTASAQTAADSEDRTVAFETPTPGPRSSPDAAVREFVAEADLGYTNLALDYIVFRPVDAFAQINGFDVRVGSIIEGFEVEEITADAVRLRDHRGPLVLRVE